MYQIEKIIRTLLWYVSTFEMFCQVMDQYTENYECLVINNNAKSNNWKTRYSGIKHPHIMIFK